MDQHPLSVVWFIFCEVRWQMDGLLKLVHYWWETKVVLIVVCHPLNIVWKEGRLFQSRYYKRGFTQNIRGGICKYLHHTIYNIYITLSTSYLLDQIKSLTMQWHGDTRAALMAVSRDMWMWQSRLVSIRQIINWGLYPLYPPPYTYTYTLATYRAPLCLQITGKIN